VFKDGAEKEVAGIVVVKFAAGLKLEVAAAEFGDEVVDGVEVARNVGEELGIVGIAGDAGSVVEELGDGDAGAGVLAVVGEIVGDVAVEFDGAFGNLLNDEHGSELLGDRTETEFDVGSVGDVPLTISETVAAFEDDFVVFGDENCAREFAAVGILAGKLIDFGGFVGGLWGRRAVEEHKKNGDAKAWAHLSCLLWERKVARDAGGEDSTRCGWDREYIRCPWGVIVR